MKTLNKSYKLQATRRRFLHSLAIFGMVMVLAGCPAPGPGTGNRLATTLVQTVGKTTTAITVARGTSSVSGTIKARERGKSADLAGMFTHTESGLSQGTFTINAMGVWTYTVSGLTAGGADLSETITVNFDPTDPAYANPTALVLTFTIQQPNANANLNPTITGGLTGSVTEDALATQSASSPMATATGSLTIADSDGTIASVTIGGTTIGSSATLVNGQYGQISATFASGTLTWTYTLGAGAGTGGMTTDQRLDALNASSTAMDTFAVVATDNDGATNTPSANITITVNGADELLFAFGGTWGESDTAGNTAREAELMVTAAELGSGIEAQGTLIATLVTDSTMTVTGTWSASSTANRGGGTAGNYGNFGFDSGAPGAWAYDIDPMLVGTSSIITETITVTFTSTATATMGETQEYELRFIINPLAADVIPPGVQIDATGSNDDDGSDAAGAGNNRFFEIASGTPTVGNFVAGSSPGLVNFDISPSTYLINGAITFAPIIDLIFGGKASRKYLVLSPPIEGQTQNVQYYAYDESTYQLRKGEVYLLGMLTIDVDTPANSTFTANQTVQE